VAFFIFKSRTVSRCTCIRHLIYPPPQRMAVIGHIFTTLTLARQPPVIKRPTPMLNDDPRHRVPSLVRDRTETDGRMWSPHTVLFCELQNAYCGSEETKGATVKLQQSHTAETPQYRVVNIRTTIFLNAVGQCILPLRLLVSTLTDRSSICSSRSREIHKNSAGKITFSTLQNMVHIVTALF